MSFYLFWGNAEGILTSYQFIISCLVSPLDNIGSYSDGTDIDLYYILTVVSLKSMELSMNEIAPIHHQQ